MVATYGAALASALTGSDNWAFWLAAIATVAETLALLRSRLPTVWDRIAVAFAVGALLRLDGTAPAGASAILTGVGLLGLIYSGYRNSSRTARSATKIGIWVSSALICLVAIPALLSVVTATGQLKRGHAELRSALRAATQLETVSAREHLVSGSNALRSASDKLDQTWVHLAGLLPLWNRHINPVRTFAEQGSSLAGSATSQLDELGGRVLEIRQGRVDLNSLAKLSDSLDNIASQLTELEEVSRASRQPLLLPMVDRRFGQLNAWFSETAESAAKAAQLCRLLPAMLGGADTSRRWLLLIASPAEARELGGFTGTVAVIEANHGRLDLVQTIRSQDLSDPTGENGRFLPDRASYPERFLRYRPERFWQNVTGVPDFPTAARAAQSLFEQSTGITVDGVIYLDTFGFAAALKVLGPVKVPGLEEALTADNATQFLHRDQYALFMEKAERAEVLDILTRRLFQKFQNTELRNTAALLRSFAPLIEQRRLLFWSARPDEQSAIAEAGADGAFPSANGGDLLSIRHANAAANKIDTYLFRETRYVPRYDPASGEVTADLTITLRNEAPETGLPRYIIGSPDDALSPGTNRMLLSIYSALDLRTAQINGKPVSLERLDEFGVRRYSIPITIGPGESLSLHLYLAGTIRNDRYQLRLVGQPLSNPEAVHVEGAMAGSNECGARRTSGADGKEASAVCHLELMGQLVDLRSGTPRAVR
ncbi:MAG: DUF4012 domain-containing protein [Acidimicrobiales bacterium]|nr:DUF4012 domain-containing protein [Acidimicrobiales bacterium]